MESAEPDSRGRVDEPTLPGLGAIRSTRSQSLALLCQILRGFWRRARSLGGRRDAERAAAVRSRKARPAIPRADFPPSDPRKAEYHRRISASNICRPHASVVGAGAEEYELGALSRRVERRRAAEAPRPAEAGHRHRSDKVVPARLECCLDRPIARQSDSSHGCRSRSHASASTAGCA